jgi:alpha-1,2-mannosyltransferase
VCIGKEWYRFPSHFFLPEHARLRFIKSDFSGLLPQYFLEQHEQAQQQLSLLDVTSHVPQHMNERNAEEPTRYVNDVSTSCDYIVDLDLVHQNEPHYNLQHEQWRVLFSAPFLDATHSPALPRAFYIPFYSAQRNTFAPYQVLKRIK